MEYAIVIGLVIAAALGMQIYVKRNLQGKMKDATDYRDPATPGTFATPTRQFEPDYAVSVGTTQRRDAQEEAEMQKGGKVIRSILGQDVSDMTGNKTILRPTDNPVEY